MKKKDILLVVGIGLSGFLMTLFLSANFEQIAMYIILFISITFIALQNKKRKSRD